MRQPMTRMEKKLSKKVLVINELGVHARTAARISTVARPAVSRVWITKNGRSVDASGILDILTLECAKGAEITISVENSQDCEILNAIAELIEKGCEE